MTALPQPGPAGETDTPPPPPEAAGISTRSLERARRALRCLPLRRAFYELAAARAMSSTELAGSSDQGHLCFWALRAAPLEEHFIWLIRLGVLRREVDGQGLTQRVRLTPMGRELLGSWPAEIPRAPLAERIRHQLTRLRPRW